MKPEQIESMRRDFEEMEAKRQSARDLVKSYILDARVLLAPDRDMPKELRAEIKRLLDRAIARLDDAFRRLPHE